MAIYVGETVAVRVQVVDPFTKEALEDLTGEVEVFQPGLDPKKTPTDRTPYGPPYPMVWDADAAGYVAYIPTDGFDAGKWAFRAVVTGASYDGWEYGTFKLDA